MMNITPDIHRYLTTAPTSHFLGQPVTVLDHWAGRDHLLWRVESRGREAVLKLFLDAGQARSRRQHDGQTTFAPYGIAPPPIWVDRYPEGLARQVLVYTWQPGEPISAENERQLAALARSVGQLHGGDLSEVSRFSPNPVNLDYFWRIVGGGIVPLRRWLGERALIVLPALFDQLAERAEQFVRAALPLWQGVTPTPVHGDLRLENAIDSFGSAILLDWELYGLGDPALDVASFLYHSQAEISAEARATWVENYLAYFDQPRLAERIAVYGQLLPVQALMFLLSGLRQYRAATPTIEQAKMLPFVADSLQATLQQTAAALHVSINDELQLRHEVDELVQIRGSQEE